MGGPNLPITFQDYLNLLDWTGRQLRVTKRGSIAKDAPEIFDRLGYSPAQWLKTQQPTINWRQRALGTASHIKSYCIRLGRNWIWQSEQHAVH